MDIGVNVNPREYGEWFPRMSTPAFARVFSAPRKGLPNWDGYAIRKLPPGCLPHISHKDEVPMEQVAAFWDDMPPAPAGRRYRWTFRHEPEPDYPLGQWRTYWKQLRRLRDSHPRGGDIELVAIHTLYASRWKAGINWRDWMLPGIADTDGWDCYPPTTFPTYEPPESLFGLPIAAAREYGMPLSIPEFGSTLRGSDDGRRRAEWFAQSLSYLRQNGCTAVGLWCSRETVKGRTYDYRPVDSATLNAWRAAMAA